MAIFLKNSAGKILRTSTGKCLTAPSSTSVCTITFNGDYVSWTSTTKEALLGDLLSVSGSVVICKRNGVELWRNTATIYADTDQYDYGGSLKILVPTEVASDIVITANGATRTLKKTYAVTLSSNNIGIQSAWLSTSSSATSGSATLNVTSGTVVYTYAVLGTDTTVAKVKNWTLIGGTACKQGAIYRVSSQTITAATTINVNLFDDSSLNTAILYTRSGESVGSWTINTHVAQMAEDYGGFVKSGYSFSITGSDYNGLSHTYDIASFTCPSGYTVSFTITNGNGDQVALNSKHYFDGPYIIEAETEPSAQQS